MQSNALPAERVAIVGVIDPDAYAEQVVRSGYISVVDFRKLMFILSFGDMVASSICIVDIYATTSAGPTDTFRVTGSTVATVGQSAGGSNTQVVINLDTDALIADTKYTHVRLTVEFLDAGADFAALVLGFDPRSAPASLSNLSSVDEVVSV